MVPVNPEHREEESTMLDGAAPVVEDTASNEATHEAAVVSVSESPTELAEDEIETVPIDATATAAAEAVDAPQAEQDEGPSIAEAENTATDEATHEAVVVSVSESPTELAEDEIETVPIDATATAAAEAVDAPQAEQDEGPSIAEAENTATDEATHEAVVVSVSESPTELAEDEIETVPIDATATATATAAAAAEAVDAPQAEQDEGPSIAEAENTATDEATHEAVVVSVSESPTELAEDEIETVPIDVAATAADASQVEQDAEAPPAVEAENAASPAPAVATPPEVEAAPASAPEVKQEEPFKRGQLVKGVVTATSPMEVTCALGDDHVGIIPSRELERMNRQLLEEMLEVGKRLTVFVINPRDHQGRILLSVNRALEEQDWQLAQEHYRARRAYPGFVAGYNKGGLIVRFGRLRGFVPMSQIADARRWQLGDQTNEEQWRKLVNQPITVKVIEVNRKRSRLVLSESAAAREQRDKRKVELLSELKVGDVRSGPIVSLADFGVFVDLGGAEGLVHNSELSWRHIKHPRDAFKVGQGVRAEVISIDREKQRIGLSIKRQELDPWDEVAMRYTTGQLVQATITKLTKFGAFAQLVDSPQSEGLVHISELADGRVEHPREVVQPGEKLTLRITRIDIRNRRLGLSLKRVNSAEFLDMDWQAAPEAVVDDSPAAAPPVSGEEAATPGEEAATPGEEAATPGEEAATPGEEAATPGEEAATPEEEALAPEVQAADNSSANVSEEEDGR